MIERLVREAANAGVLLSAKDNELHFKLTVEEFPEALKSKIVARKAELITFLSSRHKDNKTKQRKIDKQRDSNQPLSFSQQRLWFVDQLGEGSPQYNIVSVMRVDGGFDVATAEQALNLLISKHTVLKSNFITEDGKARQVVNQEHSFVFERQISNHADITQFVNDYKDQIFSLESDLLLAGIIIDLKGEGGEQWLVLKVHHIVFDGASLDLFIRDFTSYYNAIFSKLEPAVDELEIQYSDYAAWQRQGLQEGNYDDAIGYWVSQLVDSPLTHSLPLDRARPDEPSTFRDSINLVIGAKHIETLRRLSSKTGMTQFMLLHAFITLVLSRFSNQSDIVVGTPVTNRDGHQLADMIGFFANTIALRVNTQQDNLLVYLDHVKQVHYKVQQWQDVPLEVLVDQLGVVRSHQYSPIFQILLSVQAGSSQPFEIGNCQLHPIDLGKFDSDFDLDIRVHPKLNSISIDWLYSPELFDKATVQRIVDGVKYLLEAIPENYDCKLNELNVLSAVELQQINHYVGQCEHYSYQASVIDMFEYQAENAPNSIAINIGGRQYSYSELNRAANRIARHLTEIGAKRGRVVGVYMDRTESLLAAVLAVLKTGSAYLPLDPNYPEHRLNYLVSDSDVKLVITNRNPTKAAKVLAIQSVVHLAEGLGDVEYESYSEDNLSIDIRGNHLAYIIYTSGSTGGPKGVLIQHKSLSALVEWANGYYAVSELANVLASTSLNFDLSVFEIFAPLTMGGACTLVDSIVSMLEEPAIGLTLINTVPSGIEVVLAHEVNIDSVKVINLAGEPLKKKLVNRIFDLYPDVRVANLYGPSEDTTYSTECMFTDRIGAEPSIGKAITYKQALLLNFDGAITPLGCDGELNLLGAGVAQGYLNQPELTAERFIHMAWAGREVRCYKTGDFAKYQDDGVIKFLGRADEQIKLRGFRIELGEVESVIEESGLADEVCVVCRGLERERQLVAFWVPRGASNSSDLEKIIEDVLPRHSLPGRYIKLEKLPRNANGKIDRKALIEYRLENSSRGNKELTDFEAGVAKLWCNELSFGLEFIGPDSNFFSLGGNSISAVMIISQVNKLLLLDVSLKVIFSHPTLSDFCSIIEKAKVAERAALAHRVEQQKFYPLTSWQRQLWLVDKLQGFSNQYNMPFVFHLDGGLNALDVEFALKKIIQRHTPLRTVFSEIEGDVFQSLLDCNGYALQLQHADLSSAKKLRAFAKQEHKREQAYHFSLKNDFPIKARFVKCVRSDRCILTINIHHIAFDGWSLGLLANEFIQLLSPERHPNLPQLKVDYLDYALWQHGESYQQRSQRQLSYWGKQLDGIQSVHSLPLLGERPSIKENAGASVKQEISFEAPKEFELLCEALGMTPFMVLHAIFSLVIARYSGRSDVVVGSPVANRADPNLVNMIGLFVNTVVLRTNVKAHTLGDYLEHIKSVNIEALSNQEVSFESVVERCAVNRDSSHAPLFQILFTLENNRRIGDFDGNLKIELMDVEQGLIKYDLELYAVMVDQRVDLQWVYDIKLFPLSLINEMQEMFGDVLDSLITISTSAKQALSKEDLEAPLHELHKGHYYQTALLPSVNVGNPQCIHKVFECAVENYPERIGLVDATRTFSYAELNKRANKLARVLLNNGAAQGDRIGIALDRSAWQSIALLSILKIGAVYVPVDARIPRARNLHIIKNSGLKLIVCEDEETLAEMPVTILCVGVIQTNEQWVELDDVNLEINCSAQDAAYLLYTSGSTGEPKGVIQTHRTITNLVNEMARAPSKSEGLMTLQFAPLTFDVSIQELTFAWATSSCIRIITQQQKEDLSKLSELIINEKIERAFFPPTVFQILCEQLVTNGSAHILKQVYVAGEAFHNSQQIIQMLSASPGLQVWNHYGPTETHVASSALINEELNRQDFTIGSPVLNTKYLVIDDNGNCVPKGISGELCITGMGVAIGYQSTGSSSFIRQDDMFDGYLTGDIVRELADGRFEFIGRRDNQVSINGYRIELSEITHALKSEESVFEAQVAVVGDGETKRLHAYVQATQESDLTSVLMRKILDGLKTYLPHYMLPREGTFVQHWPLTANGKIDFRLLNDQVETVDQPQVSELQGEVERGLATIWAKLLNCTVEGLGRESDFFDLGGTSLLAVKLLAKVRQQMQQEFSLSAFYSSSSLISLASILVKVPDGGLSMTSSSGRLHSEKFPASSGQKSLLSLSELDQSMAAYNMQLAVDLVGRFELDIANSVCLELLKTHHMLRTKICRVEGEWYQQLSEGHTWEIDHHKVRDESTALQLQSNDFNQEFNLAEGKLLRVTCIEMPDQKTRMLFNIPHIVGDGWSVNLLLNQFVEGYRELTQDRPWFLEEPKFQYRDYVAWQNKVFSTAEYSSQIEYWRTHLEGAPVTHSLPLDYPRPSLKYYAGAQVSRVVDSKQAQALISRARQLSCTPFVLFHGVLALTVARFSGKDDIVIGTPVANRNRAETHNLVGYLANTIALRTEVNVNQVDDYFTHVKGINALALDNLDVPFDRVVEEINPTRDASHTPLFQILLNMNESHEVEADDVLSLKKVDSDLCNAKFDLDLAINTQGVGYELVWTYDLSIFSEHNIGSMVDYFMAVLDDLNSGASNKLEDLGLAYCSDALHVRQQQSFNFSRPKDGSIIHAFERQVALNKNKTALYHGNESYSFGELAGKAQLLANALLDQKLSSGDRVVIYVSRSIDMVVAMLATIYAGGVCVPVDEKSPLARVELIAKDSKASLLLTDQHQLAIDCVPVCHLDRALVSVTNVSKRFAESTDVPAYIIYTSGTSGAPKGVVQSQHNVLRLLSSSRKSFDFTAEDTWVLFHSIAFDFSVWELWGALLTGASLVIPSYETTRNPDQFSALCEQFEVTVLNQTPSAFSKFSESVIRQEFTLDKLRYVIFGGEKLNESALGPWFEYKGGDSPMMVNMYGITETTVHVTYKHILPNRPSSSVGRELEDQQIYVLDKALKPLPPGAIGELYVAGAGLATEYFENEALTQKQFVINPYASQAMLKRGYGKMYKSGDLGRYLKGGEIEHLGRNDTQVNINGFRIELGEVEAILSRVNVVHECSVLAVPGASLMKLVCFVVMDLRAVGSENEGLLQIRKEAVSRLPLYMIPQDFIVLEHLPLTSNGKMNYAALSKIADIRVNQSTVEIAAENTMEKEVLSIWRAVLKNELCGVEANFFASGGDSIKVVRLVEQLNRAGYRYSLQDIYQYQNVRDLICYVDTQQGSYVDIGQLDVPESALEEAKGLYPEQALECFHITSMQTEMIKYLDSALGVYHPQQLIEFSSKEFDLTRFQKIIDLLVGKHPSLRSFFFAHKQRHYQVVLEACQYKVEFHDFRMYDQNDTETLIGLFFEHDLETPFCIATENIRFAVLALSDCRYGFFVSSNHAIEDGWGMVELFNELFELYTTDLPTELSIANNCVSELAQLEMDALSDHDPREYWESVSQDYVPISLGDNYDKTQLPETQDLTISQELVDTLKKQVGVTGVPMKTLFLFAFIKSLREWLGEPNITVDSITSKRSPKLSEPFKSLGLFWGFSPIVLKTTEDDQEDLLALNQRVISADSFSLFPAQEIFNILGAENVTPFAFKYVDFYNNRVNQGEGLTEVERVYSCDTFHHPVVLSVDTMGDQLGFHCSLACRGGIEKHFPPNFLQAVIGNLKSIITY